MHAVPFSDLRARLADTLRTVEAGAEPVMISRRGVAAGVLMSWPQYCSLAQGNDGFAARLTQWRLDCYADTSAEGVAHDEADPFAEVRDPSTGRDVELPE